MEALIGVGRTPGGVGAARGDVEEVAAERAVGSSGIGGTAQGAEDAEPGAGEDGKGEVTDAGEEGAVGPEDGAAVAEVVGEGVNAGGEGALPSTIEEVMVGGWAADAEGAARPAQFPPGGG